MDSALQRPTSQLRLPWLRLASVVGFLLVWQGLAASGLFPESLLPRPASVFGRTAELVAAGTLLRAVGLSMLRLVGSYVLALAIGLPAGFLLGRSEAARQTVGTFALGLQALPSICWLPLAVLWFGRSEAAIVAVTVIGAGLSMTLSAEAATRNIPPLLVRAARTMGLDGLRLQTKVLLPAAMPELIGGARLAWTFAWRSLMAAELLTVNGGLGQLLTKGRELNDLAMLFAVMGVIVTLGLVVERVVFYPAQAALAARWGTNRG